MGTEIIKAYRQEVPAMRFIGKKYGDNDRVGGMFGAKWGEWHQNGWFAPIENTIGGITGYEDADACIGLMRYKDGEPFEYWIGMFAEAGAAVPDGYAYRDFPAAALGVCWIKGAEHEVYVQEDNCAKKLEAEGYEIVPDEDGAWWFMERYGCPRFTTPDENGEIILDICHFVK